ncbi:MAG TPA: hypothetical protein VFN54_04760 [Acidimicrobiales bacterium]|nr:hypothetical protein [Acidimicrobiales bacterium]
MATKNRPRSRRSQHREGTPYVAPVLDPTWQSPYVPSAGERHANAVALRRFAIRRKIPASITVGVAVVVLVALFSVSVWLPVLAVLIALVYAWDLRRSLVGIERQGQRLGATMRETFRVAGTSTDRARLDTIIERLTATFGVDGVEAVIVDDPVYNAALVPNGSGLNFFITVAAVHDFDLIEIEGVVAHCLARHRLGLLERQSAAALANVSDEIRRELYSPASAYRADEVAAATIRYPLGLAAALRRCANQAVASTSFFAGETYAQWHGVWFNPASGRATDFSDLDDVTVRAAALEEW